MRQTQKSSCAVSKFLPVFSIFFVCVHCASVTKEGIAHVKKKTISKKISPKRLYKMYIFSFLQLVSGFLPLRVECGSLAGNLLGRGVQKVEGCRSLNKEQNREVGNDFLTGGNWLSL